MQEENAKFQIKFESSLDSLLPPRVWHCSGGFESAAEAITAAFGANYNPWGGDATNWQ